MGYYLKSCLVPNSSVIECPWSSEEKHDGNQSVQDHGQHQGDQVEERDVSEEHGNVHGRVTGQAEITFRNLEANG